MEVFVSTAGTLLPAAVVPRAPVCTGGASACLSRDGFRFEGFSAFRSTGPRFSSVRFCPQHIAPRFSGSLRHRFHDHFSSHALQKARAPGKRQPAEAPLHRPARNKKRRRSRDPQTQAEEAVHQLARQALPQQSAQPDNQIRRAVLARQQVSHPPGCKDGDDELHPRTHLPATVQNGM